MKIRPLPETDLANVASLPIEQRTSKLERINEGHATWSYRPVKSVRPDIFNCSTGFFDGTVPTDWDNIRDLIEKRSRSSKEQHHNIVAARALYNYCKDNSISSRYIDLFPLSLGIGIKVEYWSPLLIVSDKKPIVPFIDPRIKNKLTQSGRRFAFSVMHERIRAADPDFADVIFCILQFRQREPAGVERKVVPFFDEGIDLMSFAELDQAVAETYSIWEDILNGRDDKRRAAGGRGPLI